MAEIKTPPVVTTDFLYLRLIGDRSIQEKDFGRIQIDRVLDMQKWIDNLKTVEDDNIKLAIMTANNHYAGFGPGTVNIFRNMIGLPEAKWEEKAQKHLEEYPTSDSKQRTISDFQITGAYFLNLMPVCSSLINDLGGTNNGRTGTRIL